MEFISYDEATKTSTIKLDDDELLDLLSVMDGVLATFSKQDATILDIEKDRLELVSGRLRTVLRERP